MEVYFHLYKVKIREFLKCIPRRSLVVGTRKGLVWLGIEPRARKNTIEKFGTSDLRAKGEHKANAR